VREYLDSQKEQLRKHPFRATLVWLLMIAGIVSGIYLATHDMVGHGLMAFFGFGLVSIALELTIVETKPWSKDDIFVYVIYLARTGRIRRNCG
jgi:hypothetical protein